MKKTYRLIFASLAFLALTFFTGCDTPTNSDSSTPGTTGTLRITNNATLAIEELYIDTYAESGDDAVNPLGPNRIDSNLNSGGTITFTNIPAGDYSVRLHHSDHADGYYSYYGDPQWRMVIKANVENKLTFKNPTTGTGVVVGTFTNN